jgi:hypothetical protein
LHFSHQINAADILVVFSFTKEESVGWLDRFSRKDPSDGWALPRQFKPEIDLRSLSLSGVALGSGPEDLQRFGRPENKRPFRSGRFLYPRSGVLIELEEGRVGYFAVALGDDPLNHVDGLDAMKATLIREDGEEMDLSGFTTLTDIRCFLPCEPVTDIDADEIVDTFSMDGYVVEIEARPNGRLKRINLFTKKCESADTGDVLQRA